MRFEDTKESIDAELGTEPPPPVPPGQHAKGCPRTYYPDAPLDVKPCTCAPPVPPGKCTDQESAPLAPLVTETPPAAETTGTASGAAGGRTVPPGPYVVIATVATNERTKPENITLFVPPGPVPAERLTSGEWTVTRILGNERLWQAIGPWRESEEEARRDAEHGSMRGSPGPVPPDGEPVGGRKNVCVECKRDNQELSVMGRCRVCAPAAAPAKAPLSAEQLAEWVRSARANTCEYESFWGAIRTLADQLATAIRERDEQRGRADALAARVLDPTEYDGPATGIDLVDRLRGIYANALGGERRFGSSTINREAAAEIERLRGRAERAEALSRLDTGMASEFHGELEKARDEIKQLRAKLADASAGFDKMFDDVKRMKAELSEQQAKLKEAEENVARVAARNEELQAEQARTEAEIKRLTKERVDIGNRYDLHMADCQRRQDIARGEYERAYDARVAASYRTGWADGAKATREACALAAWAVKNRKGARLTDLREAFEQGVRSLPLPVCPEGPPAKTLCALGHHDICLLASCVCKCHAGPPATKGGE